MSDPGNDARSTVMARMRKALGRSEDREAKEAVRARLASPAPTLVPARADLDPNGRVQLFIDQAKAFSPHRVVTADEVRATLGVTLGEQGVLETGKEFFPGFRE